MTITTHTPPRNQGQIIEISYGWCDDRLYRRTEDRSVPTAHPARVEWAVALPCTALDLWEGDCWQEEPPDAISWHPCAEPSEDC